MKKEIKFEITNKLIEPEGNWVCSVGVDEYEVLKALKIFLHKKGIGIKGKDIYAFRNDGCAMCDDCQTEGNWFVN